MMDCKVCVYKSTERRRAFGEAPFRFFLFPSSLLSISRSLVIPPFLNSPSQFRAVFLDCVPLLGLVVSGVQSPSHTCDRRRARAEDTHERARERSDKRVLFVGSLRREDVQSSQSWRLTSVEVCEGFSTLGCCVLALETETMH